MKKYIIGVLIGFVLSLGVGARAEVVNMIGKVIDGSFPIKINGKTLTNQALTIEGVSYVPTKEFAESLGATVKFDANLGIEVVPSSTPIPTPTSTPTSAPTPTVTKTQKIQQLQSRIEFLQSSIVSYKMSVWDYDHHPDDSPESQKQVIKENLAKNEKELADLQSQLDALQK